MNIKRINFRNDIESRLWLDLYKVCFPSDAEKGSRLWAEWWNLKNPYGAAIIYGLFDGSRMIGSYSFARLPMMSMYGYRTAGAGVNAMMHPEYRGQKLFKPFLEDVTDQEASQTPLITFPFSGNKRSIHLHESSGWTHRGYIGIFKIEVPFEMMGNTHVGKAVEAHDLTRVIETANCKSVCLEKPFIRTMPWIRWRYCMNPTKRYLAITRSGYYMVLNVHHRDTGSVLQIIDCRASGAFHMMMEDATLVASGLGIRIVEFPVMLGSNTANIVTRYPLTSRMREETFSVFTAGEEIGGNEIFLGDTDIP